MITFNGQSIYQACPDIKIEDIRESPVQLSPVTRQRPILPGDVYVRMQQGAKNIVINFAVLEMDMNKRKVLLNTLSKWARTDSPAPLAIKTRPNVMIDAVCTKLPEPSMRQWWESKLSLTFTAYDPYWYSVNEYSVSINTSTATTVFINGDVPPLARFTNTRSSALQSTMTFSDGVDTMSFSRHPAGTMNIDLNKQTAQVGSSTSIMQYFDPTTTFLQPKLGSVSYLGVGKFHWRERWL